MQALTTVMRSRMSDDQRLFTRKLPISAPFTTDSTRCEILDLKEQTRSLRRGLAAETQYRLVTEQNIQSLQTQITELKEQILHLQKLITEDYVVIAEE
jgi:hypothetical protein